MKNEKKQKLNRVEEVLLNKIVYKVEGIKDIDELDGENLLNLLKVARGQDKEKKSTDYTKVISTGIACGTVLLMYATGLQFEKEGNINPIKGVSGLFGLAKGLF